MGIDPVVFVSKSPPGSAAPARVDVGAGMECAFLLREESKIISLHVAPVIEIRAALILKNGVGLLPVLVRSGEEKQENIFETWLNYSNQESRQLISDLATQPRICILFVGDTGQVEKKFEIVNSSSNFFKKAEQELSKISAWTMRDFDKARERVYEDFPSVWKLWKSLKYFR